MRRSNILQDPELQKLSLLIIRGFDGDGDGGNGSGDDNSDAPGSDGDADGEGDGDGDADDGDAGDADDPNDVEALKKALKTERELRKKTEKGLKLSERDKKKLQKAQADLKAAEDGEVAAAKKQADEANEKTAKLAVKLRNQAVEAAITKAAQKANFRDADDVIAHLQRNNFKDIEIDQDDDDPSDIDIDEATVTKAVKAVATAKPHWLVAEGDEAPSGSRFNSGGGGKGDAKTRQAELAGRYPALKNRIGS